MKKASAWQENSEGTVLEMKTKPSAYVGHKEAVWQYHMYFMIVLQGPPWSKRLSEEAASSNML